MIVPLSDNIIGVLARVYVKSIDDRLPFYQQLSGGADVTRFGFGDVSPAWVGSFC